MTNAPLYSLQYAPMKNAALFSGALVTPSSATFGTWSGSGVGSTYAVWSTERGWNELIVGGK